MMRIMHVGNVANIAYLTVKALRSRHVEADVYVPASGLPAVSFPEWEDGDFDVSGIALLAPDWARVTMRNGWQRPSWVRAVPEPTWHFLPFAGADSFVAQSELRLNTRLVWQRNRLVNESLRKRGLPELDFDSTSRMFDIHQWEKMVRDYDIVVAYGADPINCLIDFPTKPYVAVDYGSQLRTMMWDDCGPYDRRLLRASFEWADQVVLTNSDNQRIAEDLGLRYRFIPHPVDEEKFYPGHSMVRAKIEERYGQDVTVLFAPARHDWAVKGNDKMIRALARLVRKERRTVVLILTTWGENVDKSRQLIRKEEIEENVVWQPMLPKVQMGDWYRAADLVLDQFSIGAFGLATAEAMACGKPVLLHFIPEVHRWCFPELPPVVATGNEDEIFHEATKLVRDADLREKVGRRTYEWFLRYHSSQVVAERHIQLYRDILTHKAAP